MIIINNENNNDNEPYKVQPHPQSEFVAHPLLWDLGYKRPFCYLIGYLETIGNMNYVSKTA